MIKPSRLYQFTLLIIRVFPVIYYFIMAVGFYLMRNRTTGSAAWLTEQGFSPQGMGITSLMCGLILSIYTIKNLGKPIVDYNKIVREVILYAIFLLPMVIYYGASAYYLIFVLPSGPAIINALGVFTIPMLYLIFLLHNLLYADWIDAIQSESLKKRYREQ